MAHDTHKGPASPTNQTQPAEMMEEQEGIDGPTSLECFDTELDWPIPRRDQDMPIPPPRKRKQ